MKKNLFIVFIILAAAGLAPACNGNISIDSHPTQDQTATTEQQITSTPTGKPEVTPQTSGPIDQGNLVLEETHDGQVTSRDGDQWTFTGTVGDQISIAVDGVNSFDTMIDLYDPNGTLLISDDDSGSGYNSLINGYTLPYSGDFTVVISGYGGARGAYSIALTEGVAVVQSSIPVDMGAVEYGQEISGEIEDTPGQTFAFSGTAGDIVNITLTGDQGNSDTFLELYNASGTQVTFDNDSGVGAGAAIQNFTLPSSGVYTILARFFEGGAGAYTLSLNRGYVEVPANQPGECMTDAYDMGLLTYGETNTSFTISDDGDRYLFTGEAGDEVFINTYGIDEFDPYLELYDQACNAISSNDDSNGTLDARIAVILPSSGAYTIIITSLSGGTGDYLISLSEGEEITGFQSDPQTQAYDMGSLLIGGNSSSYTINSAGDRYHFNATAGMIISITSTSNEFSPILELYDPAGVLLTNNGGTSPGNTASIRRFSIPSGGEYSIIIRGMDGSTGNYTITLTQP